MTVLRVPINDIRYMFGDNDIVVNSSSISNAKLYKRHNVLFFHRVCEAIASKYVTFTFLPGAYNSADIFSMYQVYSTRWNTLY